MPVFNAYHYDPLSGRDHIRLLVLNPAKNRITPLSCSIIPHRLASQDRKYSAVSYAWGDAEATHSLAITHNDDTAYLKITVDVDILLRHFRAPREVRYLWIDAICLNQGDEIEKAHQIPAMGRIYKEAMDVRIWLGVANVMTSTLYGFFREVSRGPELKQGMMAGRIVALMKRFFHDDTQPALAEDAAKPGCRVGFESLIEFFQNPWFSRRWIIQEAVLARKAIANSGSYDIPFGTVTLAAKRLLSFDVSDYPLKVAATMGERAKKSSLMENLWMFHEARCREKKDRIASLIGLGSPDGFELNYKNSWQDIYKQVASSALCSESNEQRIHVLLHLFEFGAVTNTASLSYPSWVPDWSKTRKRELPYHSHIRNVDTHEEYPAFITVSDKAALTLNDEILHIQPSFSEDGYRVWQVLCTISSGKSPFDSEQVISLLEQFFPLYSAESSYKILELSSFIQYIGDFCHLRHKDPSDAFTRYTRQVLRNLSESINSQYLEALRWLGILLQDFCFCELRPYGLNSSPRRGFGVGPYGILPDDIMIPLWRRLENGPKTRFIVNSGASITMEIVTMLVVRCDEGIHRWPECEPLEDDGLNRRGRIIGPALAIEFGRSVGLDENHIPESKQSFVNGGFFVF